MSVRPQFSDGSGRSIPVMGDAAGRARPRVQTEARPILSERFERNVIWLFAFSSFFVLIEPAPVDILLLVLAPIFLMAGARIDRSALIPIGLLLLFNVGGLLALIPWAAEQESVRFVAVSLFVSAAAIFFLALISVRAMPRLAALSSGTIWAGAAASTAGLLGFFNVAGLGSVFSLYGRASGTFKDPNVLGPFVVLPLLLVIQRLLLGRGNFFVNATLGCLMLVGGILLSFSRGAWADAVGSITLLFALTFLFAQNSTVRRRVMMISVLGGFVLVTLGPALLGTSAIRDMLEVRASLSQSYDLGETGRFGNQLRSLGELIELPNGFGPVRFRHNFPEDPHNVYINAFASYGWLGGFSYFGIVIATVVIGWRAVATRSPEQPYFIAIWSTLFIQMIQGFQIDTDHWRQWFMMLGLIWGMYGLYRMRSSRGLESSTSR